MKRVWMTPQERQIWRMTYATRFADTINVYAALEAADWAIDRLRDVMKQTPAASLHVLDAMGIDREPPKAYWNPKTGEVVKAPANGK